MDRKQRLHIVNVHKKRDDDRWWVELSDESLITWEMWIELGGAQNKWWERI